MDAEFIGTTAKYPLKTLHIWNTFPSWQSVENSIEPRTVTLSTVELCTFETSKKAKYTIPFVYVYVTVHRNKFPFNKTNRRTNFPNLFWLKMDLCIFRAVPLPIIRSSLTVNLTLVYVIQVFRELSRRTIAPARKLSTNLYGIHHCWK
jgi:hypothetical protein